MKTKITIAIATVIVLITGLVAVSVFILQGFDSKLYVKTVLEQTFYGKVEDATEIIEGSTEEELIAHYEDGVAAFVKSNVLSGVEVDEETEKKFVELGEKIFGAMKFDVETEEKISREEYKVTVSYETSDIFLKYVDLIAIEQQRISDKVQKGEYKGTAEEINKQMQDEFLENAYLLLEEAYNTMEYSEKESTVFRVFVGGNDMFQMDDAEIKEFIVKIMRLDEIQD